MVDGKMEERPGLGLDSELGRLSDGATCGFNHSQDEAD